MKITANKRALVVSIMSATTFLSVMGSTAGSLAWYVYSRTVTISYVGTSVKNSVLLNIGLVDDDHYLDDDQVTFYNLSREDNDTHSIVWTNSSSGFALDAIRDYLTNSPYSVNTLSPVSSHARDINSSSEFTLYRAPDHGERVINEEAKKTSYVQLPFAFRIIGNDGNKIADQDIWLTDATVQASGQNVDKAVRIFVENDDTEFLMNPSNKSTTNGYTVMGGLLDLDNDGTYDYDISDGYKEIVYGEYTGTPSYSSNSYGIDYAHAELVNVNNTPYTSQRSTFYAKHNKDAKVADISNVTFKKAHYYSFGNIKPSVDSEGNYYAGATGKAIATTSSLDRIGYSTFTIFLEGWDHAIIDQAIGYSFNLGLTFEINRI